METTVSAPEIRLRFGRPDTACLRQGDDLVLDLSVPWLAGAEAEVLATGPVGSSLEKAGAFELIRTADGEIVGGIASQPKGMPVEQAAYGLYRELLEITGEQLLYRVWNFVPRINVEVGGSEQYRSFNAGRCRAFRERFGESAMEARLPAASAVGIEESGLVLAFHTGRNPVTYFENPRQVPAYRYPEQYGSCSPSFARGAVVNRSEGKRIGYLSGTASICGHATVGVGDLGAQLDTTLENIRAILGAMGFGGVLDSPPAREASFRVYLRRPEDLEAVRDQFFAAIGPEAAERTMFLQADICRTPLLLEIEGIFFA